jgi:hypothetical protein
VPAGVTAQSFAESAGGQRDGSEGPGGCRGDNDLSIIDQVSSDRATVVESAPRPIQIDEPECHVRDTVSEASERE